jgi:hypothetical protein
MATVQSRVRAIELADGTMSAATRSILGPPDAPESGDSRTSAGL